MLNINGGASPETAIDAPAFGGGAGDKPWRPPRPQSENVSSKRIHQTVSIRVFLRVSFSQNRFPLSRDRLLGSAAGPSCRSFLLASGDEAFALRELARCLAAAPDRLGLFARTLLGRLFIGATGLHFAEKALTLHLLFQDAKGLVDVVVSDEDLQISS
ncbi:hypothetical protein GGD81_002560 [Rhodobium orientis]|nr:hypothetical protein [Rhodobium orientis]